MNLKDLMETICNNIHNFTGSKTFRSIFTMSTIGLGTYFLWKELTKKPDPKKEESNLAKSKCTLIKFCDKFQILLYGSLIDNGCGMAY